MQRRGYTVVGQAVERLPAEIESLFDAGYRYSGDGVEVILAEEFDLWRTNSNLQITVILERRDEETCRVELFAGGGATGLLGFTFGNETKFRDSVAGELEALFDRLDLYVENVE